MYIQRKGSIMKFGVAIFLLVVGAILAFAVQDSIEAIDLTLVGYILMGAGALGLIIATVFATRKSTSVSTTRTAVDPATGAGVTKKESSIS